MTQAGVAAAAKLDSMLALTGALLPRVVMMRGGDAGIARMFE
jgi:hypothetical protein